MSDLPGLFSNATPTLNVGGFIPRTPADDQIGQRQSSVQEAPPELSLDISFDQGPHPGDTRGLTFAYPTETFRADTSPGTTTRNIVPPSDTQGFVADNTIKNFILGEQRSSTAIFDDALAQGMPEDRSITCFVHDGYIAAPVQADTVEHIAPDESVRAVAPDSPSLSHIEAENQVIRQAIEQKRVELQKLRDAAARIRMSQSKTDSNRRKARAAEHAQPTEFIPFTEMLDMSPDNHVVANWMQGAAGGRSTYKFNPALRQKLGTLSHTERRRALANYVYRHHFVGGPTAHATYSAQLLHTVWLHGYEKMQELSQQPATEAERCAVDYTLYLCAETLLRDNGLRLTVSFLPNLSHQPKSDPPPFLPRPVKTANQGIIISAISPQVPRGSMAKEPGTVDLARNMARTPPEDQWGRPVGTSLTRLPVLTLTELWLESDPGFPHMALVGAERFFLPCHHRRNHENPTQHQVVTPAVAIVLVKSSRTFDFYALQSLYNTRPRISDQLLQRGRLALLLLAYEGTSIESICVDSPGARAFADGLRRELNSELATMYQIDSNGVLVPGRCLNPLSIIMSTTASYIGSKSAVKA